MEPYRGRQLGVLLDLVSPVGDHARRTDNEEVRRTLGPEMTKDRQRFNGLAEAHLVTEDDPPLGQRELRPEVLVNAEARAEQRNIELYRLDSARDLGREQLPIAETKPPSRGKSARGGL